MTFELVDKGWDKVLDGALRADHSRLQIICPFIKQRAAERLLRRGRPKTIQVITRFNLCDFCSGVSDTTALKRLLENGAQIRGVRWLHAKLYLIGQQRAIVTSANLTDAALLRNHEFGFVAEEESIVAQCREYFDRLWQRAGGDLTTARIDGWNLSLEQVRAAGGRPSMAAGLRDEGVDAGMTMPPIVIPPLFAEAPEAFVKFFGASDNREVRGTPALAEVNRSGCHWACTYPREKRPRKVQDGAVMFISRLVKEPDDIMVFGRAIAMRHQPGRDDATLAEQRQRPFKAQWPHYVRVHHGEFLAGNLGHGVSLNELMAGLRANSFATTKRHAESGSGNTEPRRAYLRQPMVELSNMGYAWLNTKLEEAFCAHGKLTADEFEHLDWPVMPTESTETDE